MILILNDGTDCRLLLQADRGDVCIMGNESGEWIMHGMKWDNPDCIHSVDEAIKYINEFGFLPLLIDSNRWFLCNNGGD